MDKDSTFGAEPDQLKRLLLIGRGDEEEDVPLLATAAPGTRIGRYQLLRVLGEGGMGAVYLAQQDRPIRRQVALKIIKPGMDSRRVVARFEAERQALALLDHPNIARVYDAGTTEAGRLYFVMEHVKGLPITTYCDRHKLSIDERLGLFQQVCRAVQHAHQKGIIHRDIKPSNILVCTEGDKAIPKIIDFGVAKATAAPLTERTLFTEDSQLLGTPEYMSPEQADQANEDIDTRSDVYSLGVLLYELVTGVLPFDTATLRENGLEHLRRIIRQSDPQTPSTRLTKLGSDAARLAENRRTEAPALVKRLRRELEWIPLKAARKDRTERYRSAAELADDVGNYLAGAPLIAGPLSPWYRLKKAVRRHKAFVTGLAAVLVVLAAGVVVSAAFAVGQMRALAQAERQADISSRVLNFLNHDLLMSADPARATRWEITLSEILDRAAENLKDQFVNEPLVEASIRHTLGNTYLRLGKYLAAEPHIESAYRIRRAQLGTQDPDTLASTSSLGMLRLRQGRYAEAERYSVLALEGMQEALGREHQDTLASMYGLGVVYWYQRRHAEAEMLFAEVSELRSRTLGQDHPDTLRAFNGLGWTYTRQERYAEAERLFERVFQRCLETLGQEHDLTQEVMNGLVTVYTTDASRYGKAERLGYKCLELRRHALGDEHPETLEAMGLLAGVHAKQGRLEEAERLYQAVQKTQLRLGIQDDKVLRQLVGLAHLYVKQARYGEAEPLLLQEFQRRAKQFGPQHSYTVDMLNQLVNLYESWKKPDEAAKWRARRGGNANGGM